MSSLEPDTTVLPSGLKATLRTQPSLWPWKVLRHSPPVNRPQFQSSCRTEPDTTVLPSGLKATLRYPADVALESLETLSTRNRPQFQSLVVPSQIQRSFHLDWMPHCVHSVAVALESLETLSTRKQTTVSKSCRHEPDTMVLPSGLNATLITEFRCGPGKSWRHSPLENRPQFQSHCRSEPDTMVLPSGLKATPFT